VNWLWNYLLSPYERAQPRAKRGGIERRKRLIKGNTVSIA